MDRLAAKVCGDSARDLANAALNRATAKKNFETLGGVAAHDAWPPKVGTLQQSVTGTLHYAAGMASSTTATRKITHWRRSRILVTGGAGFIGSAVVWKLNQHGCSDVVIADRSGREERAPNLRPLKFAAYVDSSALLKKLSDGSLGTFDCIFHLGACSSTTETDEDYLRRNNFEYSRDLAAWALAAGTRFVYASSAATYGNEPSGNDNDPGELDRLQPLNAYARSKHQMDLHAWRNGWLERIVGLKYFNVFGPNEGHKGEMRSLVHKSVQQVREHGKIRLFKSHRPDYKDGEQRRDFLYVKDAAAMTLHLAAAPQAKGLFNLGSGKAHSWNELARGVFAALDLPARIEYIEMPETLRDHYQYFTQANISKLRAAGYHEPITPFDVAVRDYVRQYLVPGKSLGEEPRDSGA
jgi:ADP-L-glycero-D-manno-heptose 6-epimerase